MIDWLESYEEAFGSHELIKRLKELKFHGKLEINFNDGKPQTTNIQMFCKAGIQVKMTVATLPVTE